MTRYLISFDEGAMADLTADDLREASRDSHRVVADARAAGVWVTGGGMLPGPATVVHPGGSVTTGPYPHAAAAVGGFALVDAVSHEDALRWAARLEDACRCSQQVRVVMDDVEV